MYWYKDALVFSPSDLTLFTESQYASWIAHYSAMHDDSEEKFPKDAPDAMLSLLQDKGDTHEHAVLAQMKGDGLDVAEIDRGEGAVEATLEAMRMGADVIFQACLTKRAFKGYADFLVKIEGKSEFGDYLYEVWDTKLSRTVKPYFTIQLCCYQEMLFELQQAAAEHFVIVLGDNQTERLRTQDYFHYYLSVKDAFLTFHDQFNPNMEPKPADSKNWGDWSEYAKAKLIEQDHLSQVAHITRGQIKKLEESGIATMAELADPNDDASSNLHPLIFERLQEQAKLQIESRDQSISVYKILHHDINNPHGLLLLPPHSDLDVFFDIEGFPFVDGGLEYLWGNTYFDKFGERQFKDFWAHNAEQEKESFKAFIEWVYARWQQDPNMHIYHYANYEIAACKKLMSRYGVCQNEVDTLLRNGVFIDLYQIVKSGLRIGTENYSIKSVELLYRGKRDTDVGTGGDSVVVYENWRDDPDGDTWETSAILKSIRDYNIDDCDSTQELVAWLRMQQATCGISFVGKLERAERDIPDDVQDRLELEVELLAMAKGFLKQAEIESDDNLSCKAKLYENLAWFLDFHRREDKPVHWAMFERFAMEEVDLFGDLDCLAFCVRTEREPFKQARQRQSFCYEYAFDTEQEYRSRATKSFYVHGELNENGSNIKVSFVQEESRIDDGVIVVKSTTELPYSITLIPDEIVPSRPIPGAIHSVISDLKEGLVTHSAILDFLEHHPPRIHGQVKGAAIARQEHLIEDVTKAVVNLKNSYLPIQGPPGTGKSYTSKHVIAELVRQGKRVGISSNSHKAINSLLVSTAKYCQDKDIVGEFACSKDTGPEIAAAGIQIANNKGLVAHIKDGCVIGTTSWGFARPDWAKQFDYLFIDEAGQVSVANLIGMSQSAKNLVLIGDQMQLGQPTQASHPADSGLSILDYLMHGKATIPEDQGVFLGTSYRMHSSVNKFISDAVYEGKLHSHHSTNSRFIDMLGASVPIPLSAGILLSEVEHSGNTQASDEEIERIVVLTQSLLGRTFHDGGYHRSLKLQDIIYVAPYNHQVSKLKKALKTEFKEEANVGSVDKFQGQEAPVVILSMCASEANDSPRGLDFLFDKNRLNVAISRAQCIAIVVANPMLKYAQASNIKQQKLINTYAQLCNAATKIEGKGS